MTSVEYPDDYYFDFGVNKQDLSIKVVDTEKGQIFLNSDEVVNPFFISLDGGSTQKLTPKEIYSYKHVLVVTMKKSYKRSQDLFMIYNYVLDKTKFKKIAKNFVILKASVNLLKNNVYKNIANVVEQEVLESLFGLSMFDTTEIVVPMFELTDDVARVNISLYDTQFGIENVEEILSLTSHYNKSYKRPVIEQLSNHMSSLRETGFWSDERNCDINMTDIFIKRRFDYSGNDDNKDIIRSNTEKKDKDVERVIGVLSNPKGKDIDYLDFLDKDKKTIYTDIHAALAASGKRTYYANIDPSTLKVKREDITELICSIEDEKELYCTFNSLLISKEYCHMVLNNSKVLDKVKPLIEKYMPIYKYLFGYAWLCFYIEECIFKTKSIKDSRFVFDIDTASKLPVFPISFDDVTQNPYVTLLVDKRLTDPEHNCIGIYPVKGHDGYGVCTLEQFRWRFNLFTSGDPAKDIFNGISWNDFSIVDMDDPTQKTDMKHSGFATSGSVVTACIQKSPVLLKNVASPHASDIEKWLAYFNHYYEESDIDLMCNDLSIFGFTSKVNIAVEKIRENIGATMEEMVIEPKKTLAVIMTKDFFKEKEQHIRNHFYNDWTIDQMIENLPSKKMKEYLYLTYIENKIKQNNAIRYKKLDTNNYIEEFMEISSINDMNIHLVAYEQLKSTHKPLDSEICYYVNDFRDKDNQVSDDKNVLVLKISESIKFKIRSSKMLRTIELFRAKSNDFFGVVARFHLPCVRAYYQGDNVYLLPSCITSMMTDINIDYKYFAGVRDPIDIINKYRMRNKSSILADDEKKHMAYYNNHVTTFGKMFHVGTTDQIKNMFGPKEITDSIFKPFVALKGFPDEIYQSPKLEYVKSIEDVKKIYKDDYGYDPDEFGFNLFKYKTINDDGSIMPYKAWLSNEYYDKVNAVKA
jgi:hypothetical protein